MKVKSLVTNTRYSVPKVLPVYFSAEKVTMGDIIEAYFSCVKRKGNKNATKVFEKNLKENLETLLDEINSGTYTIQPSKGFVVTKPKVREIWAATYRDRIVHHLIYNKVAWWYEKRFIYDSYSCIKERGVLQGFKRVEGFARSITNNWDPKRRNKAFYLKLDIANYFMSLDIDNLCKVALRNFTPNAIIGKLFEQVIRNDFRINAELIDKEKFKLVPSHKSAFNIPYGKGIAIGNLTSQFLSNVYLNELDQYVKRELRVKYYGRYVDDMILMSDSKEQLEEWHMKIKTFLRDSLKLEIAEDKTIYGDIYKGFDFIGYVIKPFRSYMRKETYANIVEKIDKFIAIKDFTIEDIEKFRSSINSYFGLIKHTKSFNIRKKLCEKIAKETIFSYNDDYTSIFPDKEKANKYALSTLVTNIGNGSTLGFRLGDIKVNIDKGKIFKNKEDVKASKKPICRHKKHKKKSKFTSSEEGFMKDMVKYAEGLDDKEWGYSFEDHPRVPPILEKM